MSICNSESIRKIPGTNSQSTNGSCLFLMMVREILTTDEKAQRQTRGDHHVQEKDEHIQCNNPEPLRDYSKKQAPSWFLFLFVVITKRKSLTASKGNIRILFYISSANAVPISRIPIGPI